MRKVALIFVLAVLVPSLVLAWMAVRTLRDQQFLLERQQSLLYQRVTDSLAQDIASQLETQQQSFSKTTEVLMRSGHFLPAEFDSQIRHTWPLAEVGFCVTVQSPLTCAVTCPSPSAGPDARQFLVDNGSFLGNRETAEVYWNASKGGPQPTVLSAKTDSQINAMPQVQQLMAPTNQLAMNGNQGQNANSLKFQTRAVNPQAQVAPPQSGDNNLSKVSSAEAEFLELIGNETDGMLARFLQNKLKLMFWHRLSSNPNLIFGAQVSLPKIINSIQNTAQTASLNLSDHDDFCVAILDDNAKPQVLIPAGAMCNWKHPFVATEIGEALPHWEAAIYLMNPDRFASAAQKLKLTLYSLTALLIIAIGCGGWLIGHCLNKELRLARQKTDFVSNVSHELKTPLTSIRMFSELLSEGRATEQEKQRSYLNIIASETARLTRLIDNVLDFSRMERGEKKYNFKPCDLVEVTRNAVQTFRPHLEANGFKFDVELPDAPIPIRGDCDALSQIIVNLLSNAEKYSNGQKDITLRLERKESPVPYAQIKVLDRGSGVPKGSEEKIFEKFYRAHDSLSSGIQGSGLGLTIARQIAEAHGGNIVYEARDGGGSCFSLSLPIKKA